MPLVTLARNAMATRFELVLHGENPVSLRAAGEEALDEIEQLEARLSLFRPGSEIAHLNARASQEPVRVTPALFALLEHAQKLHDESGGAFDITIAPLVRCWGFMHGSGHIPKAEDLAEARAKVGMSLVQLDSDNLTVRFAREGVMLDLGAIGKGYAIERAAGILREDGVTSALLHGGTSTVYALGHPPEADSWRVAIEDPVRRVAPAPESGAGQQAAAIIAGAPSLGRLAESPDAGPASLAVVSLKDEAMSVSAVWGKCFRVEGRSFGHILDPRTGAPATAAVLAAVVLSSATETDALSTALLTLGPDGHERIAGLRPGMRTLVVSEAEGRFSVQAHGIAAGMMMSE